MIEVLQTLSQARNTSWMRLLIMPCPPKTRNKGLGLRLGSDALSEKSVRGVVFQREILLYCICYHYHSFHHGYLILGDVQMPRMPCSCHSIHSASAAHQKSSHSIGSFVLQHRQGGSSSSCASETYCPTSYAPKSAAGVTFVERPGNLTEAILQDRNALYTMPASLLCSYSLDFYLSRIANPLS